MPPKSENRMSITPDTMAHFAPFLKDTIFRLFNVGLFTNIGKRKANKEPRPTERGSTLKTSNYFTQHPLVQDFFFLSERYLSHLL